MQQLEATERTTIEAGLERLFHGRWREPAYEGPGAEAGWYRFSAVNREGRRERLELQDGSWALRPVGG